MLETNEPQPERADVSQIMPSAAAEEWVHNLRGHHFGTC